MRQRLEKHLAVHNQTRSPWGPIDLRLAVGAWSGRDGRTFSEFVDEVESQLRHAAPETQTTAQRTRAADATPTLDDAQAVRG
jgi:hypothetical protein